MLSSFVFEEVGFVSFKESEWAEFLKFQRVKKGRTKDPVYFVKYGGKYYPIMHKF